MLRRTEGFELVGEAAIGAEAIELADARSHPALVLMDINMPEMNGVEATRRILAERPSTVVFLCSTYDASDLPTDAPTSGARGVRPQGAPRARRRCSGCGTERDAGAFVTD